MTDLAPTTGTALVPVERLDEAEARRLTEEVRSDAEALWRKLVRLYEGEAHVALGYSSWYAYCEAEFEIGRSQSYRMLDAGRVVAAVPQLGNESQARALAPLLREDEAAAIAVFEELQASLASEGRVMTANDIRVAVADHLGRRNRRKRSQTMREIKEDIRERDTLEYAKEHNCSQLDAEIALGYATERADPAAQWIVCPWCGRSEAAWTQTSEWYWVRELLNDLDAGHDLDRDTLLRVVATLRSEAHGLAARARGLEKERNRFKRQVKQLEERLTDGGSPSPP